MEATNMTPETKTPDNTVFAVIERGGRLSVMPMTGLLPGAALPSFVVEGPFETRKQAECKMRNMAY
jgi:hypothetical protein